MSDDRALLESFISAALEGNLNEDGEAALGAPCDGGTSYEPSNSLGLSTFGSVWRGRAMNPWRSDVPQRRVKRRRKKKRKKKWYV